MFNIILGYFVLIVGTAVLWLPLCILGLINARWSITFGDLIFHLWAKLFLRCLKVTYAITGQENLDPKRNYVICSNHRSHMDGPLLVASLWPGFSYVMKKSLALIPFWGWALWAMGNIPIVRHDPKDSRRGMSAAAKKIRSGRNILIFPEGTRSPTGEMLPFKKGAAVLAIEAQVPVLPVSISGTRDILPKKSLKPRPGHAKIVIGKPIETAGMTYDDRNRLNDLIREEIERNYQK